MASVEVEDPNPVIYLIYRRIILPAQTHIQRQVGQDLPFILEIRQDERVPQPSAPPGALEQKRADLIVQNSVVVIEN